MTGQKKRPNIVYLMFDQCRAPAAPHNPYVRLPFLEEVAATGIEFTRAYATIYAKTESLYECLLHVPLVIRPPGGMAGRRVEGLVDLVDLFPTILSLAGVEVPDYTQGSDLVSWVRDGGPPLRDAVFSQVGNYHGSLGTTYPAGMPAAGRHPGLMEAARTTDFSYIRDPDYGDEAYDLRSDPHELLNVLQGGTGVDPAVDELRRRVDQWHEECRRLRESLGVVQGLRGFDYE